VLLRAKGEGVYVDTGIGGTGVVLVGLDNVEVGTLTLREAVLAVKLKLGSDHRVLTPAVHVKGGLGKNECSGVRKTGASLLTDNTGRGSTGVGHLEDVTIGGDECIGTTDLVSSTEGVHGVGKSINGISVVERLGTKGLVKGLATLQRSTVVNVGIRLDNPHKLLTGVVEVELDLVGRRTNRLVASELNLLNQILVRVLGHLAALIGVKEDVVNVKGGSNKRLLVGLAHRLGSGALGKRLDSPEALTNGAEVNVDLNLVVLKSNKRKSKSGVAAKPELKGHVKGGLGKGVAGSAHLGGSTGGGTRSRYVSEGGVGDVGKLGGVSDHLVVTSLLLLGKSDLVPDVHPITVLTVDALTSNLYLNLSNELLTNEVQPTGIDSTTGTLHVLVNLGKSDLKVGAVGKIAIAADCAGHTATEIGLSGEGLLNALHGKVGVASVRHLPESNLGGSGKENVLCAVGD